MVDEREGGVGGAPDPPHFDFVAAIIIVLLGDDGLVRVEVGAAHEVMQQPRKEQLVLVQLRRSTIFRDVALELETPQEEDGNRSLEEPDSTERFITLL